MRTESAAMAGYKSIDQEAATRPFRVFLYIATGSLVVSALPLTSGIPASTRLVPGSMHVITALPITGLLRTTPPTA